MAALASSPYISSSTPDTTFNTLANTPTWAVGVVCIIIVLVSFFLELALKKLNMYLERTHRKPLQDTLARMKEDVMMLGFISLMLVITRDSLAKICVPDILSDYMLPCNSAGGVTALSTGSIQVSTCSQSEKPIMSTESLHQLHMFIFVMAIVHVCYSCMTMILARLQIRGWRHWENEIRNQDALIDSSEVYQKSHFLVDRVHGNPWSAALCLCWIDSFFRQFWNPVKKSDYLNLRRGFVKRHNAGPKFNFLNYMMTTMEDDFKTIVAIRAYLWMFVIIFMLLNIHGWYTYFWIAFVPFVLLLIVGTKLQHVITSLALEIVKSDGKIGDSVKPRDELFWFNNPQFVLHLIHFILFQNSFELAYFVWIWSTYGWDSCFMEKRGFVYGRVGLGFVSQILCSYTTLPLYALVTQMGSSYKKAILSPPVAQSLLDCHHQAKHGEKKRTDEENEQMEFQSSISIDDQQDSSDSSRVSKASREPVCEAKDSGILPQKHSSHLSIITEELKQQDSPATKGQEEHVKSTVNPLSGAGPLAEVKRTWLTTLGQSNADISNGFVSVAIESPVCKRESSRHDHLQTGCT